VSCGAGLLFVSVLQGYCLCLCCRVTVCVLCCRVTVCVCVAGLLFVASTLGLCCAEDAELIRVSA